MQNKAKLILRAAEKLFMSRRYHEVTVEEVARRAGVGKGTIYRYFKDKEELYYQIILTGLDELVASLGPAVAEGEDAGQALRRMVSKIVEFHSQRESLFALMHSVQLRRSGRRRKLRQFWRERSDMIAEVLSPIIGRNMEAGRYRKCMSAGGAARLLLGMVRAALSSRNEMPQDRDLSEVVMDVFERGFSEQRGGLSVEER